MLSAVVLAAAAVTSGPAARNPEPPIACQPRALTKAQRQRQQELLASVQERSQGVDELPDGYRLRLPADAAFFLLVAEWASLERLCCPFLDLRLEWTRHDAVSVTVTGGEGVKEFLKGEIMPASAG